MPEPEHPDADIVVDRFRKELNTDYLDIVQIHCMMSSEWTSEQRKQMDILETLKSKWIIKAHGVSIHSFEALEAAAASSWVDVIHVRINPFGAAMDSGDPAQVTPVIEKMYKSGKGIIGMKLVGGGNFRNDMRLILLFPMLLFLFSLPLTGQDDGLAKLVKRGAQLEKLADGFQFTEGPSSDSQGHGGIMLICHRKNNVYITLNLIIKL